MTFLLIAIGTMALSLWAAARVKSVYRRYSELPVRSGLTGAEAAYRILRAAGIRDVEIVEYDEMLGADDGGAGVLAHRQHAAGADVGVLQQVGGHVPVVGAGLGVIDDATQLGQVRGAQVRGRELPRMHARRHDVPRIRRMVEAEATADAATKAEKMARLRTEAVSVLISRKDKKIYVRQGLVPVFDAPVTITDPDAPLGTHLFIATAPGDDVRFANSR